MGPLPRSLVEGGSQPAVIRAESGGIREEALADPLAAATERLNALARARRRDPRPPSAPRLPPSSSTARITPPSSTPLLPAPSSTPMLPPPSSTPGIPQPSSTTTRTVTTTASSRPTTPIWMHDPLHHTSTVTLPATLAPEDMITPDADQLFYPVKSTTKTALYGFDLSDESTMNVT